MSTICLVSTSLAIEQYELSSKKTRSNRSAVFFYYGKGLVKLIFEEICMSHTSLAAGNSSPHLKSIFPVTDWQEVPPRSKSDDLSVNEANHLK